VDPNLYTASVGKGALVLSSLFLLGIDLLRKGTLVWRRFLGKEIGETFTSFSDSFNLFSPSPHLDFNIV